METEELQLFMKNAYSPTYIGENDSFLFIDNNSKVKKVDLDGNVVKELPFIIYNKYFKLKKDADDLLYVNELEHNAGKIIGINEENIYFYDIKDGDLSSIQNIKQLNLIGIGKSKIYLSNN